MISADGISANPEKGENIETWHIPKNVKEGQSFLQLAPYFRCFINHFAGKALCLQGLVSQVASKSKKIAQGKMKDEAEPVAKQPSEKRSLNR